MLRIGLVVKAQDAFVERTTEEESGNEACLHQPMTDTMASRDDSSNGFVRQLTALKAQSRRTFTRALTRGERQQAPTDCDNPLEPTRPSLNEPSENLCLAKFTPLSYRGLPLRRGLRYF